MYLERYKCQTKSVSSVVLLRFCPPDPRDVFPYIYSCSSMLNNATRDRKVVAHAPEAVIPSQKFTSAAVATVT